MESCLQCLCENKFMDGVEECVYCCFVRNCERLGKFVCCHNKSHEKVNTIERLERMNQKRREKRF